MQNWPTCVELAVVYRVNKAAQKFEILQILFSNIDLSAALIAATSSIKHCIINVIKYLAVLCINAAVTGGHNFKL